MIYFLQINGEGGPIKIGFAKSAIVRLKTLQRLFPYSLKLLATAEGSRSDELLCHNEFEDLCINGEWFRPEQRLLDRISALGMGAADDASGFASMKVKREFLAWVKREAARRGLPMWDLVEDLFAHGGPRPWRARTATSPTRNTEKSSRGS